MGMIFMNDEDININSIISKWAKKLPAGREFILSQVQFIEEVCNTVWKYNEEQIVATTKVGLVRSALSLLSDAANEQEFRLKLVKGLASNFEGEMRGKVFESIFGKGVPGGRDPLSLRISNGKISEFKDE